MIITNDINENFVFSKIVTQTILPLSGYSLQDQYQPFIVSRKGGTHLVYNNYIYRSNMKRMGRSHDILYWECINNRNTKCRGRVKSIGNIVIQTNVSGTQLKLSEPFRKI